MRLLLLAALPLVALSACGGGAVACDCAFPLLSFVAPTNGTSNVPPNARIWIGANELMDAESRGGSPVDPANLPPITVETQGGAAVAVHVGYLGDRQNGVAVVRPDAPLTPGESYSVKVDGRLVTFFAAGEQRDESKPAVPTERSRDAHADSPFSSESECGPSNWTAVTLASEGLFLVADVDGAAQLDEAAATGPAMVQTGDELWLGTSGCRFTWNGAGPGASALVRWGTFDVAGNFSGWSAPAELSVPGGCGCTSAASSLSALFGLAFVRRRRR